MDQRRDWLAALLCLAGGAWFVTIWRLSAYGPGNWDLQMHYVPTMLYAARELADGGRGLLWNPFQNCGQPFFAISGTGLLYPLNWFFFVLNPTYALLVVTWLNLAIGGVGAFLLCRELGVSRIAALCGALTFQLGNASLDINSWSPMYGSPFAWMPVALWCCERILREPSTRMGLGLAIALTLALLQGSPQIVFYTYQLIALRVAWEAVTRRVANPLVPLRALAIGLILPPLLAAVHFLPNLEMAGASVRNQPLSMAEMLEGGGFGLTSFRAQFGKRSVLFNPLIVVPIVLAALAPFWPRGRRVMLFYLGAGLLYIVLSFGPNTPVFDWYLRLPMAQSFRGPARMLWVTGFCFAIVTAIGVDTFRWRDTGLTAARLLGCFVPVLAAIGLYFLSPTGLWRLEWVSVAALAAAALLSFVPRGRDWRGAVALLALTVNLLAFPQLPLPQVWAARFGNFRLLPPDFGILQAFGPLFDRFRGILTAQDRISIVYRPARYRLMPKSASLFGVPAVLDYEPAPTRRSAEYAYMMRIGVPMRDLNSFYYGGGLLSPLPGPLLNLTAARYVLIDLKAEEATRVASQLRLIAGEQGVGIYENHHALPRAYYVPRIAVVPDSVELLTRLNSGSDDPRQVVLVENPPPSGFTGAPEAVAGGDVEFVTNDPEHIVLRVSAPQRGFVHLADQYFEGWQATVNGGPTPILRANFLFRAVEVPAGDSVVEFRYVPLSLRIGAAVSALSVLLAIALAYLTWPRRGVPDTAALARGSDR
jgi:hypothetical protein